MDTVPDAMRACAGLPAPEKPAARWNEAAEVAPATRKGLHAVAGGLGAHGSTAGQASLGWGMR